MDRDAIVFALAVPLAGLIDARFGEPRSALHPVAWRPWGYWRFETMADGVIPIGSLEIAQLANNPNFRERGRLTLRAGGGK